MSKRTSNGKSSRSSTGAIQRSTDVGLGLHEAFEDFKLYHRAKGSDPKTISLFAYALGRLSSMLGDPQLDEITTAAMRSAMVDIQNAPTRTGEPPKVQSVHTVFVKLRTFFKWCVDEGYLAGSPMDRLSPPRLDLKVLPALSEEELRRIDSSLKKGDFVTVRNRALFYLLLDSALRLEECASLTVSDLDFEKGTVRVRKGKGRRERVSWVGSSTLRALGRYVRAAGVKGEGPLWLSAKRTALTRWGIRDALIDISEATGVHVHAHKLRRTCALTMLRSGCNVYSLQRLMGHSDLDTLRKYLAISEADVSEAHRKYGVVDSLTGK